MHVPTKSIKIIDTGCILEPTADSYNHSNRRCLSLIEVVTIDDEVKTQKKTQIRKHPIPALNCGPTQIQQDIIHQRQNTNLRTA